MSRVFYPQAYMLAPPLCQCCGLPEISKDLECLMFFRGVFLGFFCCCLTSIPPFPFLGGKQLNAILHSAKILRIRLMSLYHRTAIGSNFPQSSSSSSCFLFGFFWFVCFVLFCGGRGG